MRVAPFLLNGLAMFAAVAAAGGPLVAQPTEADLLRVEQLQDTLAAVAEQVRPSVVAIRAFRRFDAPANIRGATTLPDGKTSSPLGPLIPSVGSGVVIDANGLILTNEHVVHGVEPDAIECVLSSGDRYTATGMTTDPRSDLAVLSIEARDLQPARWGNVDALRQGHFVVVMGNPLGTASDGHGRPAMSFGIISALGQDLTQKLDPDRYYGDLIQTDATINPGNSGGPLVNLRGEVVGITTAVASRSGGSDGVGYAVPMNRVTRWVVQQLARGEEVEYGYIGVRLEERKRRQAGGGAVVEVLIASVEPNMPAQAAGLRAGDVLLRFNSEKVGSEAELARLVAVAGTGAPIPVALLRDGREIELKVVPCRRPDVERGVNVEPAFDWRGITFCVATGEVGARPGLPASVSGIVVTAVTAGSPAQQAGARPGQVLRRVNGEPVRGLRYARQLLQAARGAVTLTMEGQPPVEITVR